MVTRRDLQEVMAMNGLQFNGPEPTILPEAMQQKLAALPEHGMDFQYIDVTLHDGRIIREVVAVHAGVIEAKFGINADEIADVNLSQFGQDVPND